MAAKKAAAMPPKLISFQQGHPPQAYLTSVLAKIATTPISQLDQFLPDVWKVDHLASASQPLTSE